MKIALPIQDEKLCMHFGHCQKFSFIEVDKENKSIIKREDLTPPPHEPGVLPAWVKSNGANVVIAGGMGQRAQGLFLQQGIEVLVGCMKENPEEIVNDYLNGNLQTGANACDH